MVGQYSGTGNLNIFQDGFGDPLAPSFLWRITKHCVPQDLRNIQRNAEVDVPAAVRLGRSIVGFEATRTVACRQLEAA